MNRLPIGSVFLFIAGFAWFWYGNVSNADAQEQPSAYIEISHGQVPSVPTPSRL